MRWTVLFVLVISGLWSCGPDDDVVVVKIILEKATVEEQAVIGRSLADLATIYWSVHDRTDARHAASYAYLDRLLELLVVHPSLERRTAFDWTLHILEAPAEQEAFGFPGGQLYVTTGLLHFLESEDQLLSVLAHEMAYLDRDVLVNRLINTKDVGGDQLGDLVIGRAPADPVSLLDAVRTTTHDAEAVLAADTLMLELLCPFNYRPTGLARIYELSDAQTKLPQWLARRPADREARLDWLLQNAFACELNGVRNEAAYQSFLENL